MSAEKKNNGMDPQMALKRLRAGNQAYLDAVCAKGDISPAIRRKTCQEGQHPYAVIVTCSDSRVIPESIFCAGIGELFVIRIAGNVMDDHQLGSVEYAVQHLGCRLILVMGHTHCGAVDAAIHHAPEEGYIKFITDEIKRAIGEETDEEKASRLNVANSVRRIESCPGIRQTEENGGLKVAGALYHLESGEVEFF